MDENGNGHIVHLAIHFDLLTTQASVDSPTLESNPYLCYWLLDQAKVAVNAYIVQRVASERRIQLATGINPTTKVVA